MIKVLKSNKFISILLISVCIFIIFNPSVYAKSCLNAISVWGFKVLPLMFPFFIFTRLIVNLSIKTKPNFMDKFFNKTYHTPYGSFSTFFLATLSGYPMGAKLICTMYENKQISNEDAQKMLSFCSVSGPMFMVGTVGVVMLNSFKAGLIILISNIIASLVNGLIYRGKISTAKQSLNYDIKDNKSVLADSVYDSLISILMVASYIVLSFLVIDFLSNLHITSVITNLICGVCHMSNNHDVVSSIFNGIIEITRGILDLSTTTIPLKIKSIIASGLIGFGGVSVLLQSVSFLSKLKISVKIMLKQKFTQAILCLLISTPLCLIFL